MTSKHRATENRGPSEAEQARGATPTSRVATPSTQAAGVGTFHQAAGNLAMQRLLRGGAIQARLTVGQPEDEYEREAERIARQVTATSTVPSWRDNPSRRGAAAGVTNRRSAPHVGGSGAPLAGEVRAYFEQRLGYNLGTVRVHTGSEAASSARQMGAHAYTRGPHIAFAPGEYAPHIAQGRHLLGHELAHVIQQGAAGHLAGRQGTPALRETPRVRPVLVPSLLVPSFLTLLLTNRQRIDRALDSRSALDVRSITDFSEATELERISLIEIVLEQRWVGWFDEATLVRIWGSFGDRLTAVANQKIQLWNDSVRRGARLAELPQFTNVLNDYRAKADRIARGVLDKSELRVNTERMRYGLERSETTVETPMRGGRGGRPARTVTSVSYGMAESPYTAGLAAAAGQLLAKRRQIDDISQQRSSLSYIVCRPRFGCRTEIYDQSRYDALTSALSERRRELDLLRAAMEQQFPILAAYSAEHGIAGLRSTSDLERLAAGPSPEAAAVLGAVTWERLANIAIVRSELDASPDFVWKLDPIIDLTNRQMEYGRGSVEAGIVQAKVTQVETDEQLRELALSVIALGLGLLAAVPTGGGSLLLAGTAAVGAAGSVALSSYVALEHLHEYQIEAAAAGTDFDKARAVSSKDPTLFWLALDIIGVGIDVGAAAKVFSSLIRFARPARAAATAEAGEELVDALGREARSAARRAGHEAKGDALADAVTQSARRLRRAGSAEEAYGVPGTRTVEAATARASRELERELSDELARLREIARRPENVRDVTDPEMARYFDVEIALEGHTYRRLRGGRWCRFTNTRCGLQLPGVDDAIIDALLRGEGVRISLHEASEIQRARNIIENPGRYSPQELETAQRTLMEQAIAEYRAYQAAERQLTFEMGGLTGCCGPGRDIPAAAIGSLFRDSPEPVRIFRYQAGEDFDLPSTGGVHGFNVVSVGSPPNVRRFLVDPTFAQFMRPTERGASVIPSFVESTGGEILRGDPAGMVLARDLIRDGFVELTADNSRVYTRLYARAMDPDMSVSEVDRLSRRLLKGQHYETREVAGGGTPAGLMVLQERDLKLMDVFDVVDDLHRVIRDRGPAMSEEAVSALINLRSRLETEIIWWAAMQ